MAIDEMLGECSGLDIAKKRKASRFKKVGRGSLR
jgi:hypothetical protein